jgi:hypothetical protein
MLVYITLPMALLLPAAALAQGGPAKPAPPLRTSEEVIVTQSASGQELRGFLVELSSTTLAILVDGKRVELPIESVLRIEGRNDPVKNGAAIGAVIMGGLTVLGCGQALGCSAVCVTSSIVYTGVGALVGAGIDALHKGRTTIYSKPAAVSLAVAPAGKGARAQLKLSW